MKKKSVSVTRQIHCAYFTKWHHLYKELLVHLLKGQEHLQVFRCVLVAQSCPTISDLMDCSLPGSSVHGDSPGKMGVGCHALCQGIFLTQGLNLGLLHYRHTLYCLRHQGTLLKPYVVWETQDHWFPDLTCLLTLLQPLGACFLVLVFCKCSCSFFLLLGFLCAPLPLFWMGSNVSFHGHPTSQWNMPWPK